MYQKFIITGDGILRFGRVYLHRDLLKKGEKCIYGGGLWNIDEGRGGIVLFGRSFDFGPPDFDYVRRVEWSGVGGKPVPMFYQPHWPDDNTLVNVCTNL